MEKIPTFDELWTKHRSNMNAKSIAEMWVTLLLDAQAKVIATKVEETMTYYDDDVQGVINKTSEEFIKENLK